MEPGKTQDRRRFMMDALAGASGLAMARATGAAHSVAPRKWRYGLVGTGYRTRGSHLPILRDYFPEVEIVALCDITPENLQKALSLCNGKPAGYADYQHMLAEHPDLDAIVVVVPNYLHASMTIAALEEGKHVLTEKPMATHLADATRMIQTASQHQRILQVGFEMRYSNLFHRMAELIDQSALGDVEIVYASLFRGDWNPDSWKYLDPKTGERTNWRFLTSTAGCSLMEDGIHELDVILWLVGAKPLRIEAQGGNNVFRGRETIDNAGLLIEYQNHARCIFGFSLFTPGVRDGLVMRFYGSRGEMTFEREMAQECIILNPYHGKTQRIPVPYHQPEEEDVYQDLVKRRPYQDPMAYDNEISTYRVHKTFLHSMASGEPPFSNGEVGRDAIHIALAAEHSLRNGGQPFTWDEAEATL